MALSRRLVIPGELIAEGDYIAGANTYKEGNKIFAARIGLVSVGLKRTINVIPIKGCYIPSPGDFVIGKIVDISLSGWTVNINSPYPAFLPVSEIRRKVDVQRESMRKIFDIGDLIKASIITYDRTQDPILTTKKAGLGKIPSGKLVSIIPTKVPRLIGRGGSMVKLLKDATGCNIIVGNNGLIVVSGESSEKEDAVITAMRKIEAEAHTAGLTDRIGQLLKNLLKEGT